MSISRNVYFCYHRYVSIKDAFVSLPSCPPNSIIYLQGVYGVKNPLLSGKGLFILPDNSKIGENTLIILDGVSSLKVLGKIGNGVIFDAQNSEGLDLILLSDNESKKPTIVGDCVVRGSGYKFIKGFVTDDKEIINGVSSVVSQVQTALRNQVLSVNSAEPVTTISTASLPNKEVKPAIKSPILNAVPAVKQQVNPPEEKPAVIQQMSSNVTQVGLFADKGPLKYHSCCKFIREPGEIANVTNLIRHYVSELQRHGIAVDLLKSAQQTGIEQERVEYKDPITHKSIEIPVYLNGRFYDINTLLKVKETNSILNTRPDPITGEIYLYVHLTTKENMEKVGEFLNKRRVQINVSIAGNPFS